jgi:hypothetical protein
MSRSGADIGAENVERLRTYLAGLEASGTPVPMRNGKPNMSAIAIACGFDRQVLYKNPAAKALLDGVVAEAAVGSSNPDVDDPDEKPKTDRRDNRIRQLEQQLAAARAEVTGLREQLRRYRHLEQHAIETGRGVRRGSSPTSLGEIG